MRIKRLLLIQVLALFAPMALKAQGLTEYDFSTGQDQAKWISLGNNATTMVASEQVNKASSLTYIGFPFQFGGGSYVQFWVNSNGILSFSGTPSGESRYPQFNPVNYNINLPKICGISRFMSTGTDGYVKYALTGTAPNRVLVCEFKLSHDRYANVSATVTWQVQLYESDSKVVIVYGQAPSIVPLYFQTGMSKSASDIWTVNPQDHTATHSTGYVEQTFSVWPGNYRYYEFVVPTCPRPTHFTCTGTTGTLSTPTTATFSWTSNSGESEWMMEYSTSEDFSDATQVSISQSDLVNGTYTLTGINADTQYYARIMAWCPNGNNNEGAYSDPSDVCPFIHITFPQPTNLTFSNPGIDHITANWTAPNGNVIRYRYHYSIDGGNTWSALTKTTATSVSINNLPYAGHVYLFEVQAVYQEGESAFTTSNFITVLCLDEDKCQINITLKDSGGNGWEGNRFQVIDAESEVVLGTFTLTGGSTQTFQLNVCDEREVMLRYLYMGGPGILTYPSENSWIVTDVNGETMWEGTGSTTDKTSYYTINCSAPTCARPSNLTTLFTGPHSASFNWTNGNAEQTAWQITYGTEPDFNPNHGTIVDVTHANNTVHGLAQNTTYYAYIRANCGDSYSNWSINQVTFTTLVGNQSPTNLTLASNPAVTPTTATILWSGVSTNELHQNYELYYSTSSTIPSSLNPQTYFTGITASSLNLEGLTPETSYYVWVRDNCGDDGYSPWSNSLNFSTEPLCYAPENLEIVEGSITANNATIEWEGSSNSFQVELGTINFNGTPSYYTLESHDFTDFVMPTGWNHIGEGTTMCFGQLYSGYGWIRFINATTANVLVLPEFELETNTLTINYSTRAGSSQHSGSFAVGYVTDPTQANTFVPVHTNYSSEGTSWQQVENITFASAPAGARIAFRHISNNSNANWDLDNVTVKAPEYPIAWTVDGTAAHLGNGGSYTIHGLSPETTYKVRVRSNCGSQGLSNQCSNEVRFTTASCLASFTKDINGYGTSTGGYYLIASPLADATNPVDIDGLTDGEYDLYFFDQAEELEWRNLEANAFDLVSGKGYLYANRTDATLTFCGTPYEGDGIVQLEYTASNNLAGWNLIGNPFGSNATLDRPYYRLNTEGTALKTVTENTAVGVMEGVFVQANEEGETATFTMQTRGSQNAPVAHANILLSDNKGKTLDNAIVRFDQGATLGKFQLRDGSSKIYFPVEGQDYAIVNADEAGELPLNFKAENNGTYTLTISQKESSLSYLHLIDNMTGTDIDLLVNPSYTFDARTTDYAYRFRLMFATGSNDQDDNFCFVNAMGNLCIFGIEGEATLQVIDVTGRMLSSHQFNGSYEQKFNMAPGMYLLRLINGSEVKTQKVIVK